jgi:peptidoglycan/LPS O-acetylase OafA/YrhL
MVLNPHVNGRLFMVLNPHVNGRDSESVRVVKSHGRGGPASAGPGDSELDSSEFAMSETTPLLSQKESSGSGKGKVFLHSIEGARFFATLTIIVGHSLDWQGVNKDSVDETGSTILWYLYSIFTDLQEVVSFWFLLGGFTLSWSCMDHNLDDSEQRLSFWKRRISRLYPDTILSCIPMFILALMFFCTCDIRFWLLNIFSLLLLPGSIPRWLPLNGSMWFLFVYFWLIVCFPFILEPMRSAFRKDSALSFVAKISILWLISLAPWVLLSVLAWFGIVMTDPFSGQISWTLNLIPFMHLPEFCIGMAVAIKLHHDTRGRGDEPLAELMSQDAAPYAALASSAALVALFLWKPIHFGGTYNSRLAPLHVAFLYAVAAVDYHGAAPPPPPPAPPPNPSSLAAHTRSFFTWDPLVRAASWGLPTLLFHKPLVVALSLAAQAAGLGAFSTDCVPSPLYGTASVRTRMEYGTPLWFAPALAASVVAAFLAGWLMSAGGPVGRHVHAGFDSLLGLRS